MSEVRQWLPEDLELIAPGPELAAVLDGVDRRLLSDRDRVRLLQARNRLVAHLQAQLYTDMYAITWSEPPDEGMVRDEGQEPYPWSGTEIAMALRWTSTAAGMRLEQARQLIEDLPAVHAALHDGVIDVPKALLFGGMLGVLDRQVARRIADKVLDKAAEMTTGQLRARLRRLVIAADPDAARKQAAAALKGRRVAMYVGDNNLASLEGHELAPHRAAAGWERIDAIAKAAKASGDPRRMDELRADALLDLLIGEGIAAGGPVTNSDMDTNHQPAPAADITPDSAGRPEPGEAKAGPGDAGPGDGGTPWPSVPADGDLLNAAADPPQTSPQPPAEDTPETLPEPLPPEQGARAVDQDRDRLVRIWLGSFDRLTSSRMCVRCRTGGQGGPMPAPRRGVVDIQIPLSTLAGLDDLPAELVGFGPLLADAARQVIAERPDLQWRISIYDNTHKLITHAITNARPTTAVPAGRRTKRRPDAKTAAFVRARNRTCVAPGCRRAAHRCDLDHVLSWHDDGESEPDNLAPECRRHHTFKGYPGTDLVHFGVGTFGWTTPKGIQHTTRADPPLYIDAEIVDPCLPDDP